MNDTQQNSTSVLCWPKRLLSADDLRRHLTSQRELLLLPRTVITPLAADELRAKGVRVTWQTAKAKDTTPTQASWIYAQEKTDALIVSAVQALERDGAVFTPFEISGPCVSWARTLTETILSANHLGGIVFCGDPMLACCIANKVAGVRAATAMTVPQIARAQKSFAANLFAIEIPGRTFFEIRHMLKTIVTGACRCPEEIAIRLQELDGHAHR